MSRPPGGLISSGRRWGEVTRCASIASRSFRRPLRRSCSQIGVFHSAGPPLRPSAQARRSPRWSPPARSPTRLHPAGSCVRYTTVAPASPKAAAIPRPAPRVAPATTATRPRSAYGSGAQPTAGTLPSRGDQEHDHAHPARGCARRGRRAVPSPTRPAPVCASTARRRATRVLWSDGDVLPPVVTSFWWRRTCTSTSARSSAPTSTFQPSRARSARPLRPVRVAAGAWTFPASGQ